MKRILSVLLAAVLVAHARSPGGFREQMPVTLRVTGGFPTATT